MFFTELILILLMVRAGLAVDDGVLRAFKTLKERFSETQNAIPDFEHVLKGKDSENGLNPGFTSGGNLTESGPPELEDVYRILNRRNIWQKLKSWSRPEISSTDKYSGHTMKQVEIGRHQRQQTNTINLGRIVFTLYNDSQTNVIIRSFKIQTRQEVMFSAYAKIDDTEVIFYPDMCGKGLCFTLSRNREGYHLIFTEDQSAYSDIYYMFTRIDMYYSSYDGITLDLKNLKKQLNANSVNVYALPELQVTYDQSSEIKIHTDHNNKVLSLTSSTELKNAAFNTTHFQQPFAKFQKRPMGDSHELNVTYDAKNNHFDSEITFTVGSEIDGVIIYVEDIDFGENLPVIHIMRQYMVFPSEQSQSSYYLSPFILDLTYYTPSFKLGFPASLNYMIYGLPSADITIGKLINGVVQNNFPGFDILITRFAKVTILELVNYNMTLEDAGTYIINVTSGYETRSQISKISVYEEEIQIVRFEKEHIVNDKQQNGLKLTCVSRGKPRPKIEFLRELPTELSNLTLQISAYEKLKNSDIFKIDDIQNGSNVSRSILITRYPGADSRTANIKDSYDTYQSFTVVCSAFTDGDKVKEFQFVYPSDFTR